MISLIGTVGAGKSSLSKLLSVRERLPLFIEPVESNPYLVDYYKQPDRYAFNMQMFLLHRMFQQAQIAQNMRQCVMDMHMIGNDVFARLQYANNIMTKTDYETYCDISNTFKSMVKPPDLVVYLQCSTSVAVSRIMKRGRYSELNAPLSYWFDLNEIYESWYDNYQDSKKMLINVDNIDFVADDSDEDFILDAIMEYLTD